MTSGPGTHHLSLVGGETHDLGFLGTAEPLRRGWPICSSQVSLREIRVAASATAAP
jgi:hypothetical protein